MSSEPTETASCTHHWLLEAPKEGFIEATCRRCSETKKFAASGLNRWNNGRPAAAAARARR